MKHMKLFAALVGTWCISTSATAANLLANPGFETGDFSSWTVGGPNGGSGVGVDGTLIGAAQVPFSPARINVHSGEMAAFGAIASSAGEFLSLTQTLQFGGGAYTAGFFMGDDSQSGFGIDSAINAGLLGIYVDGLLQPFTIRSPGNNFNPGAAASDMKEFGISFVTGAGPHSVEFRISGSGTARAGISVDDFYVDGAPVNRVPAPGGALLAGAGLLALAAVRRRR
jgi:hypothetical protein